MRKRLRALNLLALIMLACITLLSGCITPPDSGKDGDQSNTCEHTYDMENIVWSWDGYESAIATLYCTKDIAHSRQIHANITDKVITAPSCTAAGVLRYTATITVDGVAYIAEKEIALEKTGHTYTNGVCVCGAKDVNSIPVKEYLVVFKDYDGTVLLEQSVKEGESAIAPANPSRDGYDFTGWDKDFNNVTSDITITATYEKVISEPQFVVSSKDAKRGDTIEVTVALKNNPGIASIILSVAFDSDALTLTEVVYNTAIGGQIVQPQNMNSPMKLYWINGFADAEGDFVLATLKFTVKSDATVGSHGITLSYNADDVYDISETNLPFGIVNGKVTVK